MASTSRFGNISESEAAAIRRKLHSRDKMKSKNPAASLLKSYLKEKGQNPEFDLNECWGDEQYPKNVLYKRNKDRWEQIKIIINDKFPSLAGSVFK